MAFIEFSFIVIMLVLAVMMVYALIIASVYTYQILKEWISENVQDSEVDK